MAKDSWYWKNRDRIRAKQKASYAANPEPAKARANAWRKQNPDKHKKLHDEYRAIHRRELADKQAARYWGNREKHLADFAARRAKNRNKQRAFARMKSATVSDQSVREQLAKHSPLSMKDFPQELVEVKRLHILSKRLTKSKNQQKQIA